MLEEEQTLKYDVIGSCIIRGVVWGGHEAGIK